MENTSSASNFHSTTEMMLSVCDYMSDSELQKARSEGIISQDIYTQAAASKANKLQDPNSQESQELQQRSQQLGHAQNFLLSNIFQATSSTPRHSPNSLLTAYSSLVEKESQIHEDIEATHKCIDCIYDRKTRFDLHFQIFDTLGNSFSEKVRHGPAFEKMLKNFVSGTSPESEVLRKNYADRMFQVDLNPKPLNGFDFPCDLTPYASALAESLPKLPIEQQVEKGTRLCNLVPRRAEEQVLLGVTQGFPHMPQETRVALRGVIDQKIQSMTLGSMTLGGMYDQRDSKLPEILEERIRQYPHLAKQEMASEADAIPQLLAATNRDGMFGTRYMDGEKNAQLKRRFDKASQFVLEHYPDDRRNAKTTNDPRLDRGRDTSPPRREKTILKPCLDDAGKSITGSLKTGIKRGRNASYSSSSDASKGESP